METSASEGVISGESAQAPASAQDGAPAAKADKAAEASAAAVPRVATSSWAAQARHMQQASPAAGPETSPEAPTAGGAWAAEASARQELEFQIVVDKSSGGRLGIDVEPCARTRAAMIVSEVNAGLIKDWNVLHPEMAVEPGDRLIQINAARGNLAQMAEECKKNAMLSILVIRPLR